MARASSSTSRKMRPADALRQSVGVRSIVKFRVIADVEAASAIRHAKVGAAYTMAA
jgi:hypothetical protein